MVKTENRCCGCPPEMGCLGSACLNRNVEVIYCDICGEEISIDEAYEVNGDDYCEHCFLEAFKKGG